MVKFYVTRGRNEIIKFALNPVYNITTASYTRVITGLGQAANGSPDTMLYNGDGSQLYLPHDKIRIYDLSFRQFPESLNNDGTIGDSANDNYHPLVINLTGDTFTTTTGVLPTTQYSVGNLPAGLEAVLTIDNSGTQATMIFISSANVHQNSDDITNLTFTFTDAAFSNTDSIRVINSGGLNIYNISNSNGNLASANLIIIVNAPPIAVDDNYATNINTPVIIEPQTWTVTLKMILYPLYLLTALT